MIEHASELITAAGGGLVVVVTSQVMIIATTTRKRLRHEREGIARLMLDRAETRTARSIPAATIAADDPSISE